MIKALLYKRADGNILKMAVKVIWDLVLKWGKVSQKVVNIDCSAFMHYSFDGAIKSKEAENAYILLILFHTDGYQY